MNKLTIYGLPLNPTSLLEQLDGASFCVSYATREKLGAQLDQAIRLVGKDGILLVDNGAFSHWKSGGEMNEEYVEGFEAWALDILERCPQAIAVIPDVIGGTLEQQHELRVTSQLPSERSMIVWHMDEPISVLLHYCTDYEHVAIGSTVLYGEPGEPKWHSRMKEVFAAIDQWEAESNGAYIRPRIHMMRAQKEAHKYPFDSSDSTNVAVNHNRQLKKSGEDLVAFAARIDSKIQSSAGPAAEHQIKRPLLGHIEYSRWEVTRQLELQAYRYNLNRRPLAQPEWRIA
jgi:hypothetical protein